MRDSPPKYLVYVYLSDILLTMGITKGRTVILPLVAS